MNPKEEIEELKDEIRKINEKIVVYRTYIQALEAEEVRSKSVIRRLREQCGMNDLEN